MKNLGLSLVLCASLVAVGLGSSAPQSKSKTTAMTCPICHMTLSSKKTATDPVAVKLTKKGKTMYCCSKCKMPASVLVKPKMSKKAK